MRTISHFINGRSVTGTSAITSPVYNPATGQVQANLERGDAAILAEAVAVAKAAQPAWAAVDPLRRARVIFKFKALIEEHRQELVHLMSSEHGKLLGDSNGELQRGLDVVEFMCGVPHLQKGEYTQGAGPGVNVHSIREPLGVVAEIPPFNFPGMIPLWMLTPAIAVGNAFILKPSERAPSAALRLAELAHEAGVPPGIVNVVQGAQEACSALQCRGRKAQQRDPLLPPACHIPQRLADLRQIAQVVMLAHELLVAGLLAGTNQPDHHLAKLRRRSSLNALRMHSGARIPGRGRDVQKNL